MTLFQAKAKLVDDMKLRNFSENTIKSYYGKCLKFLDFSKVKDTSRLTEKEFRAYLFSISGLRTLRLHPSIFTTVPYASSMRSHWRRTSTTSGFPI